MDIENICKIIEAKEEWYHKIFDNNIVLKWKDEIEHNDNFDLAINLLRNRTREPHVFKFCEDCLYILELRISAICWRHIDFRDPYWYKNEDVMNHCYQYDLLCNHNKL